jgi:SAM-dependent methyltransferase
MRLPGDQLRALGEGRGWWARMCPADRRLEVNRAWWDERVALHAPSPFYDLEGFRAGRLALDVIERGELGDVAGRDLIHLQCHFGLGTLSWARLGAQVTGVDFSGPAIELARRLASETNLEARFVCCDVYNTVQHVQQRFDVVFSSYGVLSWLPDLGHWAEVAGRLLRPGGRLHLIELHPATSMFDDETTELRLRYPYFREADPVRTERPGSYAVPETPTQHQTTYAWPTAISDVQTAVLDAGLQIVRFREFDSCHEQLRPFLIQGPDGRWRAPPGCPAVPLVYALTASHRE